MEGFQLIADVAVPSAEQVKTTIDAWNNLVAAAETFIAAAAWIFPTVCGIAAHAAAMIKGLNNFPLVRWLAGNYGHAE
jgi:hypothetical protein